MRVPVDRPNPRRPLVVWGALLLLAIGGFAAGCTTLDLLACCPSPDPIARPVWRVDLPGTWRASIQYNELTPWSSTQVEPLVSDAFLHFDADGDLQYVGLLTPDGTAGVWQIDFGAGRSSAAFRIVRSSVELDHAADVTSTVTQAPMGPDPEDPNTPGAIIEYALRADQGFGVVGFDLTWRIEDVRIDPSGEVMTGLLTQTERDLTSPAPAVTSFGGTIWLRKVEAAVVEPAGAIDVSCRLASQSGGQIPHPVGTVFDLDASETTGPAGIVVKWTVQRTTLDDYGRFMSAAAIDVSDGPMQSFTADQAGRYLVRCWATDGTQWATSFPLTTRVE